MPERYPSDSIPEPEARRSGEPVPASRRARGVGRTAVGQANPSRRESSGRPVKTREREAPPQAGSSRERLHQAVTERIMQALEAGTVPWQKPWGTMGGWPRSMSTGDRYRGVNVMLLGMTAAERGYSSPWWGTFPTIQRLGGQVQKGQNQAEGKGSTTILWAETRQRVVENEIDPETGEATVVHYPVTKAFRVFNAAQCEGLPEHFYPQPGTRETLAEPQAVLDAYLGRDDAPKFREVPGDRAYYRTDGSDTIVMPLREQFHSPAHYYATAFHEATHSTGAEQRLNRPGIANFDHFGTGQYAQEELVAQMGAALLVAETGIDRPDLFQNSVAYLQSWQERLANDRSLVVHASAQAYQAVELIAEPSRQATAVITRPELELEAGG